MSNPSIVYQPVHLPLHQAPSFAWCALSAKEVIPVKLHVEHVVQRHLFSLLLHYHTMAQLLSSRDTLVRLANSVMSRHASQSDAFLHALGILTWLQIVYARSLVTPSHLRMSGVIRLAPCETWVVAALLDVVELDFLPQITSETYSLTDPDAIRVSLHHARPMVQKWEWLPSFSDGFSRIGPVTESDENDW